MAKDLSSFCDEMLKIAVSREAAGHTKGRQGRRPIRVHNLMKKAGWFSRPPPPPPPGVLKRFAAFLGGRAPWLVGGTALGAYGLHKGKQELDALRVGHRYMEQTGQR